MKFSKIRVALAVATILCLTASLRAQDKASIVQTNVHWETSAAAGLTLTRGNSETLLANLSLASTRKTPTDEILLGASGTYGETKDQKTGETDKNAESVMAFGQYNRSLTDRWYAGFRVDFLYDAIADVDYRVTLGPLIGYYAIKEKATTLKFEAGPSGVFERQGNEDHQYAALRFAERFDHKFSDKAKMWQSLEFVPQVDRWRNYIITAEIGAEAALNNQLSLRAVFQDIYDNEPAPGRKNNDLRLLTSLVYKF